MKRRSRQAAKRIPAVDPRAALTKRDLVQFGILFLLTLVPLAFFGNTMATAYAESLARFLSATIDGVRIVVDGTHLILHFRHGLGRVDSMAEIFTIVMLLALLVATPRIRMRRRLILIGLGLTLAILLQFLNMYVFMAGGRFAAKGRHVTLFNTILIGSRALTYAFPILIWGFVVWREWLPAARRKDNASRSSPEMDT